MSVKSDYYYTRISVPIGKLTQILNWCEVSIGDRYRFMEDPDSSSSYDSWVFMFDHESDLLMFVLAWK